MYRLSSCWNHHCTSSPKEHWLVSLHCHDDSMKHTEHIQASLLQNAQPNLFFYFWGCPLANTHPVTPEGRSFDQSALALQCEEPCHPETGQSEDFLAYIITICMLLLWYPSIAIHQMCVQLLHSRCAASDQQGKCKSHPMKTKLCECLCLKFTLIYITVKQVHYP